MTTQLAQWEVGTCAKCDAYGYVILMRTRRRLCDDCFTHTPERTFHSTPYIDDAAPLWYKRRTLTPKDGRRKRNRKP